MRGSWGGTGFRGLVDEMLEKLDVDVCVLGRGYVLSVAELGFTPSPIFLQNGYINFDKRRKVRVVHAPDARPL